MKICKRNLLLTLPLAFFSFITTYAQTTTVVDNILYLIEDDHAVVARQDKNLSGDIVIPESIFYGEVAYPVTEMVEPTRFGGVADNTVFGEGGAFQDCQITSIVIPETISRLPNMAFNACHELQKVTLPSSISDLGMGTFAYCTSLTEINIPDSVSSIPRYTLGDTPSLTSISLPETIDIIEEGAFKRSGLKEIDIPRSVIYIGEDSFECEELEKIVLHWRSQANFNVSVQAFTNVPSSCVIYIPEGTQPVYSIEPFTDFKELVFYNDGTQGDIEYTESIIMVGGLNYLVNFDTKTALVGRQSKELSGDIVIPSEIKYEGEQFPVIGIVPPTFLMAVSGGSMHGYGGAFQESQISSVIIPPSMTSISELAFMNCEKLEKVVLPDNFLQLSAACFAGCINLSEINLPDSMTDLGSETGFGYWSYAFGYCKSLKSINVPVGITVIGPGCFQDSGIEELVLPENIVNLGEGSLFAMDSLKTLKLYVADVKQIEYSENTFSNVSQTDLYVPLGAAYLYSEFYPWIDFASIQEFDAGQLPFESDIKVAHEGNIRYFLYPDSKTAVVGRQNKDLSGEVEILEKVVYDGETYDVTSIAEPEFFAAIADHTSEVKGGAFQDCPITSIKLPASITLIPAGAFFNCQELTDVQLPENLEGLGAASFAHCSALKEIFIPESVVDFGSYTGYGFCSYVFGDCISLKKINIPHGVTSIPEGCFKRSGLNSFLITLDINALESDCFELPDLEYVKCEHKSFENISYTESVFPESISEVTLLVPQGSLELYSQFYPWKNFKSIEEYADTDDEFNYNAYCIETEVEIQENEDALMTRAANPVPAILDAFLPSGKDFMDVTAPEIEGLEFIGWKELPDFMPADDIKLTAIYKTKAQPQPEPLPEPTIQPAEGQVESLSQVTISWDQRPISINANNQLMSALLYMNNEEEVQSLEFTVGFEDNSLIIYPSEELSQNGVYFVILPEGYLMIADSGDEMFEVVQPSPEIQLIYTINNDEGDEGNGDQGDGDEGNGDQGNGDQGNGDEGNGDQGDGDEGNGDQGEGDEGNGDQGEGDEGGVDSVIADSQFPVNVYTLSGIKVMKAESLEELKTLKPGLYIIKGQKLFLK